MNIEPTEDQRMLRDSAARLFTSAKTRERATAAQPPHFDAALWRELVDAGFVALLVPGDAGGVGAGLSEAAVVAEVAGEHLSSAPLAEAMVAAALLARIGGEVAQSWMQRAIAGEAIVILAPAGDASGDRPVNGGCAADACVMLQGEDVVLAVPDQPVSYADNLGALPIGILPGNAQMFVIGSGTEAVAAFAEARDRWMMLSAATMLGMAAESMRQAAAYACERTAFGRPIGSFQGLAHPFADAITDVDGGLLLVRYALWLLASSADGAAAMPPALFWWAARSSHVATLHAIRVHGGYGVGLEAQAQLFWRRCRAIGLLAGPQDAMLDDVAARLWGGGPVTATDVGIVDFDFGLGEKAERFGADVKAFFDRTLTPELREFTFASDDGHDPAVEQHLAEQGMLHPDWPEQYGGQGRGPLEISAMYRAYGEAGWWVTTTNVTDMVGKIIMQFGSETLKREVLPLLAEGRAHCALGYSEPSCGSDVFAAVTRAVRDGDEWLIDGQKMFTSQGHLARYTLMLTRTDPDAAKHAGLTLFLLPLDQPGYAVNRVDTMGSERTNVTFYSGMRVSDSHRLGEVGGGVKVMAAALLLEQSTGDFFLISLRRLLAHGLSWARGKDAMRSEVGRVLARIYVAIQVLEALTRRVLAAADSGTHSRSNGPMTKLFGSEALVRYAGELMNVAAPDSILRSASDLGWIELEARRSIATTIYAGTSEVQRSIIAEVALGLPKTRT